MPPASLNLRGALFHLIIERDPFGAGGFWRVEGVAPRSRCL